MSALPSTLQYFNNPVYFLLCPPHLCGNRRIDSMFPLRQEKLEWILNREHTAMPGNNSSLDTAFDLIVIGAGPAGSLTAYTGAQAGLKVLLLDRVSFPRDKICGGLLSRKALELLPWKLDRIQERSIYTFRWVNNRKECLSVQREHPLGVTVRRDIFDLFLAEKAQRAGAHLLAGTPLTGIKHLPDKLIITTPRGQFTGRILIGADGFYSEVARLSGLRTKWQKWQTGFALRAQVPYPRDKIEELTKGGTIITFFTLPLPASLGWFFPLQNEFNLGIGLPTLAIKHVVAVWIDFLTTVSTFCGNSFPCPRPQGWYLPAGGLPRKIANGNILLVGDAAGLVDPFSGEGMYWALKSGRLAGQLAAAHLQENLSETLADAYTRQCYQQCLPEFRRSLLLALLTGCKGDLFWRFLNDNPALLDIFPAIMESGDSYQRIFATHIRSLPQLLGHILVKSKNNTPSSMIKE